MAARRLRIEIAEEFVTARPQRADIDGNVLAAGHDLLAMQLGALEFFRRGIEVLDGERDLLAGGDLDLGRREAVVLDRQRVGALLGASGQEPAKGEYEEHGQACQWSSHPCLPRWRSPAALEHAPSMQMRTICSHCNKYIALLEVRWQARRVGRAPRAARRGRNGRYREGARGERGRSLKREHQCD